MPAQPFIGQIMLAAFPYAPKNWAPCNGQLMSVQQNQALFSVLGTKFGGDGRNTFALPDLRGRAVLGTTAPGVTPGIPIGMPSGTESVTLTIDQLPRHFHTLQASSASSPSRATQPTGNLFGVTTASPVASIFAPAGSNEIALAVGANVTPTGGNQPHNNMQPYLVMSFVIALNGIFPTRD